MSERSSILTPEVIEAIARNAGAVRSAITSGDEATLLGNSVGGSENSSAPRLIKFKFVLCDVEINNINAVVADERPWKD